MKKIIGLVIALMTLTSCGSSYKAEDGRKLTKAEREEMVAKIVQGMLADKHYRIDVRRSSMQNASAGLSNDYSLEVKGDTVYSSLPFWGVERVAVLGGGNKGLGFTALYKDYSMQRSALDKTTIIFNANNGEGDYAFKLDVYDNGEAYIKVYNRKQTGMEFTGELNVWEEIYKNRK